MSGRQIVAFPVGATVGPISLGLHAEEEVLIGGYSEPDYAHRPWAVTARCRVTFHFGKFVVSKLLKANHPFPPHHIPTPEEVGIAAAVVDALMVERLAAHGLDASRLDRVTYEGSDELRWDAPRQLVAVIRAAEALS